MNRLAALALALLPAAAIAADKPAKPTPKASAPIYDTYALGSKELAWKKVVCAESNRRMLVNFGTNDCAACRVVNQALTEPKFYDALIRQFVPVYIDVSKGSPNLELLKDYGIDPSKPLPAFVVFDEEFKFVEKTKDGELAGLAKSGVESVQGWILKRFVKTPGDQP
jgi:hypothetical protein